MTLPKPESVDLTRFPWVHLNDRAMLPKTMAVYFVVNGKQETLYIGSTGNLRARFKTHHRMFDFCKLGAERIYYQIVKRDHGHILLALEYGYQEFLKPRLNHA